MASQWLKARQTKHAAFATIYILVVLAVVVVANILADRYNRSYDATSNKRYSLSEETQKIVGDLKQDATITYFNVSTRFVQGHDLLSEYANLSPKVTVKYVDVDKDPEAARAAGIDHIPAVTVATDGRTNQAAEVTEQAITGAFIRDISGNTRSVCFVTGSGEHSIDDSGANGLSDLKQMLGDDDYQTETINLVASDTIPASCTAVVVAGPTTNYLQPAVNAIKTYVENGGRAMFMLGAPLHFGPQPIPDNDALTSVLQSWGVTADQDLVLDLNPVGQLFGVGPDVPLAHDYSSQPIVANMKQITTGFPIARSLTVANGAKTSVRQLFESSDSSIATTDLNSPRVNVRDPNNRRGPFVLAAAGTYAVGKPNEQGRFVVVGSSDWATNKFVGQLNGNGDLAANAINWLCSDEELISIRPKPPEVQHITMTAAQMTMVRLVSQFVLPLIVIVAGIVIWWRRR
jgi:ABC-type uncharacterized transport system involved in gliding motility auxiliary subunit